MTPQADVRLFLRTVLVLATIASAGAALVVQAERSARSFFVAAVADTRRFDLTEDIGAYGQLGAELNARVRQEVEP